MKKITALYSEINHIHSLSENRLVSRWTLMLPGSGCEYRKKSDGCTMCGFANSNYKYTRGLLLPEIIFKALFNLAEKESRQFQPEELFIYNGGSFWNDKEIPLNFQKYLYEQVSKNSYIKKLFFENRCEYINESKIYQAKKLLGDEKRLAIGIGLESQDDFIRNKRINKGLSKKLFESKVKQLNNHDIDPIAYIFLKPIGLSEKEAFDDTIKSIEYALASGIKEIYLSCAFVQEKTVLATEFMAGNFLPPSLWTILEIINLINKNNWPVSIGGFTDEPKPIAIPKNCSKCSDTIYESIEQFRKTRVLGKIPSCECQTKLIF